MSKLREGDIIELHEGHRVYGEARKCDVYTNRKGDTSLTRTEITIGGRYAKLAGRYLVYRTAMEGGGTGMGPHDVYPDGHHVYCRRLDDGVEVDFYQTGAFTAMIRDIEPVGKAECHWVEVTP
jgi:hypothetical protein